MQACNFSRSLSRIVNDVNRVGKIVIFKNKKSDFLIVNSFLFKADFLIFRSTSESRPNDIEGKNVRPSVRPSVHKKFLQFE